MLCLQRQPQITLRQAFKLGLYLGLVSHAARALSSAAFTRYSSQGFIAVPTPHAALDVMRHLTHRSLTIGRHIFFCCFGAVASSQLARNYPSLANIDAGHLVEPRVDCWNRIAERRSGTRARKWWILRMSALPPEGGHQEGTLWYKHLNGRSLPCVRMYCGHCVHNRPRRAGGRSEGSD